MCVYNSCIFVLYLYVINLSWEFFWGEGRLSVFLYDVTLQSF